MMREDECKIDVKCSEFHEWAHACLEDLGPRDLRKAHEIGNKILDMINELPGSNPVKFLAIFEVLSVGAKVLEHEMNRPGSTVTIN